MQGQRAAGGGFEDPPVDLAQDGFVGDATGLIVQAQHVLARHLGQDLGQALAAQEIGEELPDRAFAGEAADKGGVARSPREGDDLPRLAWPRQPAGPGHAHGGQNRQPVLLGAQHAAEQAAVMPLPPGVEMRVQGPEHGRAVQRLQIAEQGPGTEHLALQEQVGRELTLGAERGRVVDAGPGRQDDDLIPQPGEGLVEQRRGDGREQGFFHCLSRGSRASRRPSPSRL